MIVLTLFSSCCTVGVLGMLESAGNKDGSADTIPTLQPSQQEKREPHYPRHEFDVTLGFGGNIRQPMGRVAHQANEVALRNGWFDDQYYNEPFCGIRFNTNGSIGLAYYYHPDRRWAFGGMAGLAGAQIDNLINMKTSEEVQEPFYTGYASSRTWYFMPAAKYSWFHYKDAYFYMKGAVGLQYRDIHYHFWIPAEEAAVVPFPSREPAPRLGSRRHCLAYQASPLCVEYDGQGFRFFAELGYGTESIVAVGFSVWTK